MLQHCCPGYSDREVGWSSVRGGATSEEVTFLDVGCGSGAITLSLLEECPQVCSLTHPAMWKKWS